MAHSPPILHKTPHTLHLILGQNRDGTACGAACGALKFCEECKFDVEQSNKYGTPKTKQIKAPGEIYGDYQMEFITAQVRVIKRFCLLG